MAVIAGLFVSTTVGPSSEFEKNVGAGDVLLLICAETMLDHNRVLGSITEKTENTKRRERECT
jgi:deferrochelatase/peroxidase EfeB